MVVQTSIPPRKILTYPISADGNGGAVFIYGDPKASRIAILSAGFADDHDIFLPFASRLAEETDTLVGVTCLPGYDDRDDKPWNRHKKDGYTFDEQERAFREAVKALRSESEYEKNQKINAYDPPGKKLEVVGIFHDWGVVGGLMWCNRAIEDDSENAPDKIVLFDVCTGPHRNMKDLPFARKNTLSEEFVTVFYRIVFAITFLCYRFVGTGLAYAVHFLGLGVMSSFKIFPLLETDIDLLLSKPCPRLFYMMYPYYKLLESLLTGGMRDFKDASMPMDLKKTPCLYLYGTKKRVNFHEDISVKVLEREEKEERSLSKVVAVEDAGHYLFVQKFDFCFNEVKIFLHK